MTPEKMFHELLGLGMKWEVVECEYDRKLSKVRLSIRETKEVWKHVFCAKDGGDCSCYDHTEELAWRHLNVFEHSCEILCRLPRAKCSKCGKIASQLDISKNTVANHLQSIYRKLHAQGRWTIVHRQLAR